jgi:hypothetical protein
MMLAIAADAAFGSHLDRFRQDQGAPACRKIPRSPVHAASSNAVIW